MTKSYFAWVVVVNVDNSEPVFPKNDPCEPVDGGEKRPSRPPRMASDTARWDLDPQYEGSGRMDTDIYPAGDSRECAIDWWQRHQSEFARQRVVSRMLIAFVYDIAQSPKPQPLPEVRPHADWPSFEHRFTEDDWTGDFKTKGERADTSLLPSDWADFADLTLPAPGSDECALLRQVRDADRDREARQINWEAKSWRHAVNQLLELVGDLETPSMRVQTLELLRRVDQSIDAPLFALKKHFMRGRPGKSGDCVDAMFPDKLHALHPGHPAYPSGHATMAHAVSLVLGEIAPGIDKGALAAAAEHIARRREVAGLHYPSDSAAGRSLAAWLLTQLKKSPDFQALMRKAAEEWGAAAPAKP